MLWLRFTTVTVFTKKATCTHPTLTATEDTCAFCCTGSFSRSWFFWLPKEIMDLAGDTSTPSGWFVHHILQDGALLQIGEVLASFRWQQLFRQYHSAHFYIQCWIPLCLLLMILLCRLNVVSLGRSLLFFFYSRKRRYIKPADGSDSTRSVIV